METNDTPSRDGIEGQDNRQLWSPPQITSVPLREVTRNSGSAGEDTGGGYSLN